MRSRLMLFLGAWGSAIFFGALGYALGALTGRLTGSEMADLALGMAGMTLGILLGNGLGATWMAKRQGFKRKAWLFWAIGALAVILVLLLAEPLRLNQNTAIMLIVLLTLPPAVEALIA